MTHILQTRSPRPTTGSNTPNRTLPLPQSPLKYTITRSSPNRFSTVSGASRSSTAPLSPYTSISDVPFPVFHAGALGTDLSEFRTTTTYSTESTATTRRHEIIDRAIRESTETPKREEPRTAAEYLHSIDPLIDPILTKDWTETERRVNASIESDASTIHSARMLSQQSQRKDEQIARLEQQVADLTRVIEAQQRRREHSEAVQAEQQQRAQFEATQIETLRRERDTEHMQRVRLEQELHHEQQDHSTTKHQLTEFVQAQQAKWNHATKEVEQREARWQQDASQSKQTVQDLQQRLNFAQNAEQQALERVRILEQQLRQAKQEKNECEMRTRTVEADSEYLAREITTIKQQYEIRDEAARLSDQSVQKQKSLLDQLTKELSTLCSDNDSLHRQLATRPSNEQYQSVHHELARMKESHGLIEIELQAQTNHANTARQEVQHMETKLKHQSTLVTDLQHKQTLAIAKEVELADVKSQVATAVYELDAAKSKTQTAQANMQHANATIHQLEEELSTLRTNEIERVSVEKTLRDSLDARNRSMRMLLEQLRQMAEKNPFNKKLPATIAVPVNAAASFPPRQTDESVPSDSTTSAPTPQALESEFGQLRDGINALLLDLHSRTRHAFGVFLDGETALAQAQDELTEKRKQLQQAQRSLAESQTESSERYQALEGQYFQIQQDLLVARTDAQDTQARNAHHTAQLKGAWNACMLLLRGYKPLHARYTDLVAQKSILQGEVNRLLTVAQEVYELRKALTTFEDVAAGRSADGIAEAAPRHPYRMHTPRISFRAGVITVLAARRFWRSTDGRYGQIIDVGSEPVIVAGEVKDPRKIRQKDLVIPNIDESTVEKAAASLIKLLDHFDLESHTSTFAAKHPQLQSRSRSANQHTLFQGLLEGHRSSATARKSGASSTVLAAPRTSLEDVAKIRGTAIFLATRARDAQKHWEAAQDEIVHLVRQSERAGEALAHEQRTAHDLLRHHAEAARHAEQSSNDLILALKKQLEAAKTQRATREEYAELHQTSELVLQKCHELEKSNQQLQEKLHDARTQERKLLQDLAERDTTIATFKSVMEEKQRALSVLDEGVHTSLQQVQSELRHAHQLQQDREQELSDARLTIQSLQLSLSQLELERSDLTAAFDANSRELIRVQGVLRSISQAGQTAQLQSHTTTRSSSSLSFASHPPLTKQQLTPSGHTVPASSGTASAVHVRHHPNGHLSVDFGGSNLSSIMPPQPGVQLSTLSSPSKPHPLAHTYTPAVARATFTPSPYAYVVPSSTASARTATATERGLVTPMHTASSTSNRVKFASDTKV